VVDLDGNLLFLNRAFATMHGYEPEELIAKHLSVFHTAEQMPAVNEANRQITETGEFTGEIWHVRRDGTVSLALMKNSLLRDADGEPIGMIGTMVDITEHKRAQAALFESERRYREFADLLPETVCEVDVDGHITFVNRSGLAALGYSLEDFERGSNLFSLVVPKDRARARANLVRRMHGEELGGTEYTALRKDGSTFPVVVCANPILKQGRAVGLRLVAVNVSKIKRVERALRESEATLRSVFWAAPVGIGLVCDGVLARVNEGLCQLCGYEQAELSGKCMSLLYADRDEYEQIQSELLAQIRRHGRGTVETRWWRKDGQSVNVLLSFAPVDMENSSAGIAFVALDITARKCAEKRILGDRAKLKSLASELSLAEERERRRIARELHDRISQSLVISKMRLEFLMGRVGQQEIREQLRALVKELGEIVGETRTLTFDLSFPILYELGFEATVAEWLCEEVEKKYGLRCEFEDDGQDKPLDEDVRVLLFRDVRELLINVVKYARARYVRVSVSRQDDRICVQVEDDGIGFDPDEILPAGGERSGYGLFSIRERLEQVGGQIRIDSRPGRGCRVTLVAPLRSGGRGDGGKA